jgi:hypothetical protein
LWKNFDKMVKFGQEVGYLDNRRKFEGYEWVSFWVQERNVNIGPKRGH